MHFRPNPRPSKSKTLVWGPEICFKEFFRWFWCRLKIGNPALHWAAFCGALKLEVTFKGWRGCVAHWLEAPRSSENQCPPLTALLTDHLIHLIRPSIVHCLSIAQQVLLFVPLTTHRTGKKRQLYSSLWSRGRPGSLLRHPWPNWLPKYSDSQWVSVQCFPSFACWLCLFLPITILVSQLLPVHEETLLWQYGQLMCCPPDWFLVQQKTSYSSGT